MSRSHSALETLRIKAQFDLAEIAAEVADTTAYTARVEHQAKTAEHRADGIACELREATQRTKVNPALIRTMHELRRVAQASLQNAHAELTVALAREEEARGRLALARNAERSLERALQVEHRKQQLQEQRCETALADDLWLQHASRKAS